MQLPGLDFERTPQVVFDRQGGCWLHCVHFTWVCSIVVLEVLIINKRSFEVTGERVIPHTDVQRTVDPAVPKLGFRGGDLEEEISFYASTKKCLASYLENRWKIFALKPIQVK